MNKLKTSFIAKSVAWLLVAISCLGMTGGLLLTSACAQMGIYEEEYEETKEWAYSKYSDRYSARVLQHLGATTDTNEEYFAEKNFKYGVIQADSYEEFLGLLSDGGDDVYLERNFEGKVSVEDVHVFQCGIGKDTYYSVNNPEALWGGIWISDTADMDTNRYNIEEYIWDEATNLIYAQANGKYYLIPSVQFELIGGGSTSLESVTYRYQYDSVTSTYQRTQDEYGAYAATGICVNFTIYDVDEKEMAVDIETLTLEGMLGTVLSPERWVDTSFAFHEEGATHVAYNLEPFYIQDLTGISADLFVPYEKGQIDENANVIVREPEAESTMYYVVSFVPEPLVDYGYHWPESDLFIKFNYVYESLYQFQYGVVIVLILSVVVFLGAFVFLCASTGHRKGKEELVPSAINKIWLEIYGTVAFFLELGALGLTGGSMSFVRTEADTFWMGMTVFGIEIAALVIVIAALELIARLKLRCFWRYTFLGWLWNKTTGGIGSVWNFVNQNASLSLRVMAAFAGISLVDFFILVFASNEETGFALLMFVLTKAILFIAALLLVNQLKNLKEAGEHVAVGDLEYKVNTEKMYWDFKKHGENLNSIGDGLANAVEERMKSERFRTELITNVSHDIKTPLTSIINYVDLLEKENIQDERVQEYLEVLDRQSARLKKLLEDLMEASKASTGNLSVNLEKLEAGVFLVQTVGEFEEKVKAQDLELVIKKPEEPIYINADGRHFWRVIDNLMNNVSKYAQPGTRVYINLEANEKVVTVTFKNTSRYALNISSEELMERFVRGDESRNTEGSGLGLSIAQSLMELMGGTFELVVDGDLFKVILTFERCGK